MLKRLTLLMLLMGAVTAQYGCGYLAAGAAGAAAAEAAEDDDE